MGPVWGKISYLILAESIWKNLLGTLEQVGGGARRSGAGDGWCGEWPVGSAYVCEHRCVCVCAGVCVCVHVTMCRHRCV